ncbi:MAG: CoA-binding protein, partial [Candidatus Krumholzibacteriota bacterium]|nr:CoA-binding protein [Candidatus Krumholzibacteriota bacterium]
MLEPLLRPATVAVIGASRDPGKVGHALLANLQAGGFAGRLVPVNPEAQEILGLPCVPDLAALGEPVDLAVVAVPRDAVKPVVESAVRAGVRSLVIVSSGFKEADAKGAELERDITRLCHARGVRLLGPNCLGLINTQHRLNATFAEHSVREGCVSVISQSGALCAAILDWAASRHLGLAKLFSMGNKADLDENDLLTALAEDEATHVVVGYLESLSSGDEFMKTAEAAASRKPVVILKVGTTTTAGVRVASSHTGALGGDEEIAYGAAFKRSGVIRAEGFEELLDIATALAMQPLPGGRRVAVITNAGGPGIMAADAVEHAGLQVAPLSRATAASREERPPAAAGASHPINVLGDADPERYALAVDAAQADAGVDAIIVILTPR